MPKKTLKRLSKRLSKKRNKTLKRISKRLSKRRTKKRVSRRTKKTKRGKKYKKLRGGMEGAAAGGAAGGVADIRLPITGQCFKQGKSTLRGFSKGDLRGFEFDGTLLKFTGGREAPWVVGGENKEWTKWELKGSKITFTNTEGKNRTLTFANEEESGRLFAALNMYASNTGGDLRQEEHAFLTKASNGQWEEVKQIILTRPTIINAQPLGDGGPRCTVLHQAAAMGNPLWYEDNEEEREKQPEFIKFLMVHGANPLAKCTPRTEGGREVTPLDLVPDDRENIKRVFVIQMLKPEAELRGFSRPGYNKEQWTENLKFLIEKYGIEFVSEIINNNDMFKNVDGSILADGGKCWWPTSTTEHYSGGRTRAFTEWVQEFVVDHPEHKLLTKQYEADVQQHKSLKNEKGKGEQDLVNREQAVREHQIIMEVLAESVNYTELTKEQMKERLNKTLELGQGVDSHDRLSTVYPIFVEVLKKIMDNNPDKKSVLEEVLKEIIKDNEYKSSDPRDFEGYMNHVNLPKYIISYYDHETSPTFSKLSVKFLQELHKYGKKIPPRGFQASVQRILERRQELLSSTDPASGAGGGARLGVAGGGAGGGAAAVAGGAQALDIYQGNITKFSECYNQGFEPPPWSKTVAPQFMKDCKVFYNSGENIEDIKKLAQLREPVNIAEFGPEHCRQYDQDKLYGHFGYRKGYYGDCPKSIKEEILCPPNILVYTPTPVTDQPDYSNMATGVNYMGKIHILNAYGLAFDAPHQKDYQLYHDLEEQDCISKVTAFYENLFTNIFKVAERLNMETVVMTFVGAGFFSQSWWISDDVYRGAPHLQQGIWVPTLARVKEQYSDIKLLCMGTGGQVAEQLGTTDIGYFPSPALATLISMGELDKTLLINAWDCWSSPGNGNRGDNSVDGHMGANTCIGYLGTGITNPHLLEEENLIAL